MPGTSVLQAAPVGHEGSVQHTPSVQKSPSPHSVPSGQGFPGHTGRRAKTQCPSTHAPGATRQELGANKQPSARLHATVVWQRPSLVQVVPAGQPQPGWAARPRSIAGDEQATTKTAA